MGWLAHAGWKWASLGHSLAGMTLMRRSTPSIEGGGTDSGPCARRMHVPRGACGTLYTSGRPMRCRELCRRACVTALACLPCDRRMSPSCRRTYGGAGGIVGFGGSMKGRCVRRCFTNGSSSTKSEHKCKATRPSPSPYLSTHSGVCVGARRPHHGSDHLAVAHALLDADVWHRVPAPPVLNHHGIHAALHLEKSYIAPVAAPAVARNPKLDAILLAPAHHLDVVVDVIARERRVVEDPAVVAIVEAVVACDGAHNGASLVDLAHHGRNTCVHIALCPNHAVRLEAVRNGLGDAPAVEFLLLVTVVVVACVRRVALALGHAVAAHVSHVAMVLLEGTSRPAGQTFPCTAAHRPHRRRCSRARTPAELHSSGSSAQQPASERERGAVPAAEGSSHERGAVPAAEGSSHESGAVSAGGTRAVRNRGHPSSKILRPSRLTVSRHAGQTSRQSGQWIGSGCVVQATLHVAG
eukprot:366112-Chlamydomonas_euryale.AAC.34